MAEFVMVCGSRIWCTVIHTCSSVSRALSYAIWVNLQHVVVVSGTLRVGCATDSVEKHREMKDEKPRFYNE